MDFQSWCAVQEGLRRYTWLTAVVLKTYDWFLALACALAIVTANSLALSGLVASTTIGSIR
jgi:hypothetical protein